MGESHNWVVVLRIRLKLSWMMPIRVKNNHIRYEPESQQWRPGTGDASGQAELEKSAIYGDLRAQAGSHNRTHLRCPLANNKATPCKPNS